VSITIPLRSPFYCLSLPIHLLFIFDV
jgi:hypothetical protein